MCSLHVALVYQVIDVLVLATQVEHANVLSINIIHLSEQEEPCPTYKKRTGLLQ